MTTTAAATLTQVDALDTMTQVAAATIKATSLRECMVLLDPELGTPAVWLDHRVNSARGSGSVAWMGHDLDTGRFIEIQLRASLEVTVMAK